MGHSTRHPDDAILDSIDAGLIVLDRDARIVKWNAWMEWATRKAAPEVSGKLLTEVFPGSDLKRVSLAVGSALASGTSSLITHALHPDLLPLKTRAGRDLLHDVTVLPIGEVGPHLHCLVHVADVTMATRREKYLRDRQNARYDSVVESAPDVILTLDGDGMIRLANPATARFGYQPKELIGQNANVLFQSQDAWRTTWRGVLEGEKFTQPVELVARCKDGSPSYFEVSMSRWQSDSRVFVTAILRDVNERRATEAALRSSERQARTIADAFADLNATLEERVQERTAKLMQAEEALRQSQKMEAIGQLTGGIAHDFNNLLQGISGALHMLQKRIAAGRIGDIDRFLQGALDSANRASSLTHRLLAFSRQQPVDPRPIDVNLLIRTIEELLRHSIGENIKMKIEGAADLWLVRCDANQLENALLNIAINARDAMPGGGTLTIATSNKVLDQEQIRSRDLNPGEYVCVTLTDTGIGMAPGVLARAFDPFYTTKPIGRGTGLGLSMIYGFLRQSEGSVRIESAVGEGTTIEICLPRFDGELDTAEAVDDEEPDESFAGSNEVVLVVEDEDVVRFLVVEVLNDLGFHALEAVDGTSAIRILQSQQRIDLLVTDFGLPDINGRQVVEAARQKRPKLPVLFMTGYAEDATGAGFLGEGMEMITKPFTMDSLALKIGELAKRN
ncbi:MAG: PAS domain-containing protein [Casimicrobiaceae bacterium]